MTTALAATGFQYLGETISLFVAFSWTLTALCFEDAGKRIGSLYLNLIRLLMAIGMLGITLWLTTGTAIPLYAGGEAWLWLAISGLIGYIIGDYCLYSSYLVIGSRFGQLFMTLAPPSAAIAGYLLLGERMSVNALIGMFVTLFGIGLSIIGRAGDKQQKKLKVTLPLKGILFGVGAGIGQGVGLVFSKLGMAHFQLPEEASDSLAAEMVPFAATQIRAIVGAIGFALLIVVTKQTLPFLRSFRNKRAMKSATVGTFFGPFVGVSLSLMAVQYTEAGIASTLMALTPIIILLPSYFLLKQRISLREIVGAVISVVGVSLFFL